MLFCSPDKITDELLEVMASEPKILHYIENVIHIFDGKRIVKEGELENIKTKSQLKIFNQIHEQERDVAKYWKNISFRIREITHC